MTASKKSPSKRSFCDNPAVLICLCLAACFFSTPLNGLSPSLSLVATDMGFNEQERDIYLGGYVGIATMLGQMLGSCVSGFITDMYSRTGLIVTTLIVDSIATGLFGFTFVTFPVILGLRVVVGGCQGVAVPIIFSLIGDYYSAENRPTASAIISSFLGGGMMIGQLFVGYCLPYMGWRQPFLLLAIASMCAAVTIFRFLVDPVKGGNETDLEDMLSKGISLPSMTLSSLLRSLLTPTAVLLVLQTLPNTIPWGVLSTHLHDLLATESHLSLPEATSLIGIFGAGCAVGGIFGGILGARLYAINRIFLPIFMGCTLATSAVLLKTLLSLDLSQVAALETAFPLLIVAGVLAAVNGANIRVLFINLTSPESRGAAIALLNLVNGLGRGCGPGLVEIWMERMRVSRRKAIESTLSLWLVAGALLCLAAITITRDEDRLRVSMRKLAHDSIQRDAGAQLDSAFSGTTSTTVAAMGKQSDKNTATAEGKAQAINQLFIN